MSIETRNPSLLRNWFIFLILVLVVFFGARSYWSSLFAPVNSDITPKAFVIKKGENTSSIADRLEKQGLIRSSFAFKWKLRSSGEAGHIEAGDFKLSPSMSIDEILKAFSQGSVDKWVTLLEGLRVEEMADELNKKLDLNKDEFLRVAKEGYMFPDTYLFNPKADASTIAQIMRDNFDKKFTDPLQNKIKALGLTSGQGVILASIVEREGRSDKVRTDVASILLKRFRIGMGLNADATIQYIVGYQASEKSWWKKSISPEDKGVESPYNTYIHVGLPPAPICNPSLASLTAVANADPTTPYLYYYHDSQGNSYYAKTLEEHNQNVLNHP